MSKHTDLIHLGRDPRSQHGVVNPPVYHASTILYPNIAAFKHRAVGDRKYRGVRYGAYGTPTTFALADAVSELEGGAGGVVTSSGLAAVTMALTAFLNSGDHLLMVDSVYTPTRDFCDSVLRRLGVETTYYDPLIGELIEGRYKIETRLGEGALSTVYAATHSLIEKRVALKVLKQELSDDRVAVERFRREAVLARNLNHPNTIRLYDFGETEGGILFITMEFLDGKPLERHIKDGGPLHAVRVQRIANQILKSAGDFTVPRAFHLLEFLFELLAFLLRQAHAAGELLRVDDDAFNAGRHFQRIVFEAEFRRRRGERGNAERPGDPCQ